MNVAPYSSAQRRKRVLRHVVAGNDSIRVLAHRLRRTTRDAHGRPNPDVDWNVIVDDLDYAIRRYEAARAFAAACAEARP